jgi:hypothetical protein
MDFRKYALAAAILLALGALWLLWLWQPERQVRLHTTHFLKKVERQNWNAAREMMAADFTDRWNHNPNSALEDARQVFSQFLFITVENRTDACIVHDAEGNTDTTVKISGNGSPVAQLVMERVNGLHQPFRFTWRKAGGAPWDWKLIHIDQPELNIDPDASF